MRQIGLALALAMVVTLLACRASSDAGSGGAEVAGLGRLVDGADGGSWTVRAGVEQITGADPGEPLTLYNRRGRRLLTLRADDQGQAHFAYLPDQYREVQSGPGLDWTDLGDPAAAGVVEPGRYVVRDDRASPALAPQVVTVPSRDDVPDTALYDREVLTAARVDVLGNVLPGSSLEAGFQYLEMRDGVRLSAMVRLPTPPSTATAPTRRSSSIRDTPARHGLPPVRRHRERAGELNRRAGPRPESPDAMGSPGPNTRQRVPIPDPVPSGAARCNPLPGYNLGWCAPTLTPCVGRGSHGRPWSASSRPDWSRG
jgi:hypothetical protein